MKFANPLAALADLVCASLSDRGALGADAQIFSGQASVSIAEGQFIPPDLLAIHCRIEQAD